MTPEELLSIIAQRRSSVLIDPDRVVDISTITSLLKAAQFAPNHKHTWPARFAVFSGQSRFLLGASISQAMEEYGDDEFKVTKARTKYARSPYLIAVASADGKSAHETQENQYSVAAGIQNLLLMAHSFGLAALWSSPPKGANSAICNVSNFEDTDHVVGLVYIGWPSRQARPVERPEPTVNWLD